MKPHQRQIRSFVRRASRIRSSQQHAIDELWPLFGLEIKDGLIALDKIFGGRADCVLEIGFGMGHSLIIMAEQNPHINFIGIEVHRPGIGALLKAMQEKNIKNIRIYQADAVEVLQQCIPNHALQKILIFFPDPWPKRRHHKRRLIQPSFVELLVNKLTKEGVLHLATDWQGYAEQMMTVLSQNKQLHNRMAPGQFAENKDLRPNTKFEKRGLQLGHQTWDLLFKKL